MIERARIGIVHPESSAAKKGEVVEHLFASDRESISQEEVRRIAVSVAGEIIESLDGFKADDQDMLIIIETLCLRRVIDQINRSHKFSLLMKRAKVPARGAYQNAEDWRRACEDAYEKDLEYAERGEYVLHMTLPSKKILTEEVSVEELNNWLNPIRDQLTREIERVLAAYESGVGDRSASRVHTVINESYENRRIMELSKDRILKYAIGGLKNSNELHNTFRNENLLAIDRLYDLPERSTYLTYQVRTISENQDREVLAEAMEIHNRLALGNLEEVISDRGDITDRRLIEYFCDAMRGAQFLVENGLRITDFTLDNFGINKETDRGGLFDFDGLVTDSYETTAYIVKDDEYYPPERVNISEPENITEKNMVYEMGIALNRMASKVGVYKEGIYEIAFHMEETDPAERPTIAEAIEQIEAVLEKIDSE